MIEEIIKMTRHRSMENTLKTIILVAPGFIISETTTAQTLLWGYYQTNGLGYFEYFQFCEEIGAKPLPVLLIVFQPEQS
jgi:hypothetical protein